MNPLRIVTAVLGFMAALLAIARDDRALVWIAIGLLGTSFATRLFLRAQHRREESDQDRDT